MTNQILGFVGDVFVERDDDHLEPFEPSLDLLAAPDLLFGNFEGVLADTPEYAPTTNAPVHAPPANAAALGPAGFDVMSLANNHAVDCGHEAMLLTRSLIRDQGIAVAGAGATLAEATAPAVVEVDGTTIATVAFASVFPRGYGARGNFPGIAPLRTRTNIREALADLYWVPEGPVLVTSEEFEEDVAVLRNAIEAAREEADVVIASFHWGDFTRPFVVTGHERRVARVAIDAGADIVAGHHHHALRGFEWYQGKPIMYGLGHFVFDQPTLCERMALLTGEDDDDEEPDLDQYGTIAPREGWPFLPLHEDMRLTMLAYVELTDGAPTSLGFVPCQLQPDGSVVPHGAGDPDGKAVVDYLQRACEHESLPVTLEDGPALGGLQSRRVVAGGADGRR